MFKALCLAGFVGLGAGSASAAVMRAVYTGQVAGGGDLTGIFVDPGAGLAGYEYVATFIYDTDLGIRDNDLGTFDTFDLLYGGAFHGVDTPITSAVVTINGSSRTFSADYSGAAQHTNTNIIEHTASLQTDDGITAVSDFIVFTWTSVIPPGSKGLQK